MTLVTDKELASVLLDALEIESNVLITNKRFVVNAIKDLIQARDDIKRLKRGCRFLSILEDRGVGDWAGYEDAQQEFEDTEE